MHRAGSMANLLMFVVETFFFFLPAGIANMMPVLVSKVPFLNVPMDFGYSFRGKRIFGDHKTWRGLVFGVIAGGLSAVPILGAIAFLFGDLTLSVVAQTFKIGAILGAGALFGDAVKSLFKRQMNIKPGGSWVPFDQIDWILGALIAVHFLVKPLPVQTWITALLLFGLLHPVINLAGYFLRVKKNKF